MQTRFCCRQGPDVAWASTEHNLEARGFFAGLVAGLTGHRADGRRCPPGLPPGWSDGLCLARKGPGVGDAKGHPLRELPLEANVVCVDS